MSDLKSKALSVGAWFFGVMFIILALGFMLQGGILTGVLMLIGAALLLPPVKRLILEKKPKLGKGKITIAGSILIFISLLFIPTDEQTTASDSVDAEAEVDTVKPEPTQKAEIKNFPEYKIVEDTVKRNIKRTVEVELSSRMDEETLIALAEKIYAMSDAKVERTFITYRLANEGDGTAWATTHYNPEFKVNIVGATASDYERIKNTNISKGEEIGSWMVSRGMDSKVTAYKKDGQVYIQELYDFGPLSKEEKAYESTQSDKGLKLQDESGKDHNEYFIINKKGDLEFWSDNGNYYTAPKMSDGKPKQTQVKSEEVILEKPKGLTRPQKNAIRSAKQYISMTGFSRDGLIDQLSSEYGDSYEVADATAAVDSLNIDWNEQAVRSAEQYLDMTGFSCDGLIEQLSSSAGSKYTVDEASYGAQQAGACS
ncbi:Ltp family lipoprotein [Psychrobacter sp. CAL346-MNA-CIBAN-0220]|uniref:Ltp family lipoprotein n=1 Tax=Psychrobacter sp. CAL346-MNA-CIBAN-0220 TaxID=3140457 RepID=UPI00333123A3